MDIQWCLCGAGHAIEQPRDAELNLRRSVRECNARTPPQDGGKDYGQPKHILRGRRRGESSLTSVRQPRHIVLIDQYTARLDVPVADVHCMEHRQRTGEVHKHTMAFCPRILQHYDKHVAQQTRRFIHRLTNGVQVARGVAVHEAQHAVLVLRVLLAKVQLVNFERARVAAHDANSALTTVAAALEFEWQSGHPQAKGKKNSSFETLCLLFIFNEIPSRVGANKKKRCVRTNKKLYNKHRAPMSRHMLKLHAHAIQRLVEPRLICVDEAGRGSLYGPMMVAAVAVVAGGDVRHAWDSKLMAPNRRQQLYRAVLGDRGLLYDVQTVDAATIDRLGLATAWASAVVRCVAAVATAIPETSSPIDVIIDGAVASVGLDPVRFNAIPVVGADRKVFAAAAASVLAKVTHDAHIQHLVAELSPADAAAFGEILSRGKGYWYSRAHGELLARGRFAPDHRKSFRPLRLALTTG